MATGFIRDVAPVFYRSHKPDLAKASAGRHEVECTAREKTVLREKLPFWPRAQIGAIGAQLHA